MSNSVNDALAYLESRIPPESLAVDVVRDELAYQQQEMQSLRERMDRIERNRDMWRGQCLRQMDELHRMRVDALKMPTPETTP